MVTYPLATLAPTISSTGITAPSFADIYTSLQASFQAIYGSDSYLDPDSQDGQMLAVFAKAISDSNNAAIAIYNSYSPATALGAALSSNVKINGLQRLIPTNSTVNLTIIGVAGTTITDGIAEDDNGVQWLLPSPTIIDDSGLVIVTAQAADAGAVTAAPNTITTIGTPTFGWQTVNNAAEAVVGAPVESDAQLRVRQSVSTSNQALTILAAMYGAIANITGVQQLNIFENDTNFTDSKGLPPHSIAVVVEGGDATTIAETIQRKKSPGASTYGTTTIQVQDSVGEPINISFFEPTQVQIKVEVNIKALSGYTSSTGDTIISNVVDFINALGIYANHGLLSLSSLYQPVYNTGFATTYNVLNVKVSRAPAAPSTTDLAIAFNELPVTTSALVVLNVS